MTDNTRIYYPGFDIIKIVLAIFIVADHTSLFSETATLFYDWFSKLRDFAIPSFFAISAFLFFSKIEHQNILKHTIKRLLIVSLVWYVISFPMTWVTFLSNASYKEIIYAVLFRCTLSGFWFFKALIINTWILYLCRGNRIMPIAYIFFLLVNIVCGLNYVYHFISIEIHPYYTFYYHTAEFFTGAYLFKYRSFLLNGNLSFPIIVMIIFILSIVSMNDNYAIICKEIIPVFIIALSFNIKGINKDYCIKCRKFSILFYVMQFLFIWIYNLACNFCFDKDLRIFTILQYSIIRFSIIIFVLYLLSSYIIKNQQKYPILKYLS